jgi:hypothetical protein
MTSCARPLPAPATPTLQALRLTLVQLLMNSKGYNMNPLQSLYYVSPACLVSLLLPFGECAGLLTAVYDDLQGAVLCC